MFSLPVLVVLCTWASAAQADTVTVRSTTASKTTVRSGEIVDYSRGTLSLRLPGGRLESIVADRIVDYETTLVPDQQAGIELLAQGKALQAIDRLRAALAKETRTWMRRQILAQLSTAYRSTGQVELAGQTFLLIVRSDPATRFYSVIPLTWNARQPPAPLHDRALSWLENQEMPAARLLGASWLLSGRERERADATLRRLETASDKRIALLATAQVWRSRVLTASPAEVSAWERQLGSFPKSLRAGPYYIVAQGLARRHQTTEAALMFLRVPILYPGEAELSAECLYSAGNQLSLAGQPLEARIAWRELVDRYSEHPLAASAQQKLNTTDGQ